MGPAERVTPSVTVVTVIVPAQPKERVAPLSITPGYLIALPAT